MAGVMAGRAGSVVSEQSNQLVTGPVGKQDVGAAPLVSGEGATVLAPLGGCANEPALGLPDGHYDATVSLTPLGTDLHDRESVSATTTLDVGGTLPAPSPSAAAPTGPLECAPRGLTVTTTADATTYAPGRTVTLTRRVTNAGPACLLAPAAFVVTQSESDLVWTAPVSSAAPTLLAAGASRVDTATWDQQLDGRQAPPDSYDVRDDRTGAGQGTFTLTRS